MRADRDPDESFSFLSPPLSHPTYFPRTMFPVGPDDAARREAGGGSEALPDKRSGRVQQLVPCKTSQGLLQRSQLTTSIGLYGGGDRVGWGIENQSKGWNRCGWADDVKYCKVGLI
ncbi:hypothetical protein Tco_1391376 [Tanacetum coccineum]|uniref:Uncharacterized protein n=1 Tax=Tanacetum coccineum TaxID=301880 RepID=A0ABQ4YMT9_9ASTR